MAYDTNLAERVRALLKDNSGYEEKQMFGGIAFMMHGNMVCGVHDADLMLRLGPRLADEALKSPEAREMDITGRPMKGMVFIGPSGTKDEDDLREWVSLAADFVKTLKAKK